MNSFKDTILELQYKYSKLFALGIPRRKFEYEISEGRFIALNTSRNTLISILTTAFVSLGILSGIISIFKRPEIIYESGIIAFGLLTIIGVLGLRQLLWLINGTEKLIIDNNTVFLQRKGTFWVKTYACQLKDVDFITHINRENYSLYEKIQFNINLNSILLLRMTVGEISFNYLGKNIDFFSDMTEHEKVLVVEQFRKLKRLSNSMQ